MVLDADQLRHFGRRGNLGEAEAEAEPAEARASRSMSPSGWTWPLPETRDEMPASAGEPLWFPLLWPR